MIVVKFSPDVHSAGLVMLMVDNCHNLLNLGHKLAHLSHMNIEKFDPLTCSFSLQYHP